LTPLGVFAIATGTAGTISIDEISRLQGFLITYTLLVIVLTLVVLPLLVSAVTPFRMRDIIGVPKASLITIFAAAKIIVLMPQLIENVKELFRRYDMEDDEIDSGAQILMPLAYPFPNLGTYVILMFVGFAAWYLGRPLDLSDQITLQFSSLFSSFIAPIVGIPFLLDIMRIPSDVMDLFVISTVYTDRIRVVLGAMHLFALTVVVLALRHGVFRVGVKKLGTAIVVSVVALLAVLLGTRVYLDKIASTDYQGDSALVQMRWMERTVPAKSFDNSLPAPDAQSALEGRLVQVRNRGTLRVGYLPDALPWAFRNSAGTVTGFDIELAHVLARDLDVSLELVRTSLDDVGGLFESGQVDLLMSGIAMTPDRIRLFRFAGSAVDLTLGFLTEDHRRKEFATIEQVAAMNPLTIGVVQSDPAFRRQLAIGFPNATVVSVSSPREFLRGNLPEIDAILYSAEGGSAWTLIYPRYSMVVPQPVETRVPSGYLVPPDDHAWANYIEGWVDIKRMDGTVSALFDHWIRGRGADSVEPRWSIIRDVLGWIE
jgi:ABC-type amino acid transport substrate-binding protein